MGDLDLLECKSWSDSERKTVAPYWLVALAILFGVVLAMLPIYGRAEAMYRAESDGVIVTLTDEPCALASVKNLPHRSTWQEKGKTYEGCWGGHPLGVVVAYWDDLTVALIPLQSLVRVTGA